MAGTQNATQVHNEAKQALSNVYQSGGWLDQARAAASAGTLSDFFTQLLAQLGPLVGPMLIAILTQLLHLPAKP